MVGKERCCERNSGRSSSCGGKVDRGENEQTVEERGSIVEAKKEVREGGQRKYDCQMYKLTKERKFEMENRSERTVEGVDKVQE